MKSPDVVEFDRRRAVATFAGPGGHAAVQDVLAENVRRVGFRNVVERHGDHFAVGVGVVSVQNALLSPGHPKDVLQSFRGL